MLPIVWAALSWASVVTWAYYDVCNGDAGVLHIRGEKPRRIAILAVRGTLKTWQIDRVQGEYGLRNDDPPPALRSVNDITCSRHLAFCGQYAIIKPSKRIQQTRRKPATQSYGGQPGQPVANGKILPLLFAGVIAVHTAAFFIKKSPKPFENQGLTSFEFDAIY